MEIDPLMIIAGPASAPVGWKQGIEYLTAPPGAQLAQATMIDRAG